MQSEKEQVLNWLYRQVFPDSVLRFDEMLYEAVSRVLHKSAIDAEAFVQKNTHNYWNEFLERQDNDVRLGRVPLFLIRDGTSRKLMWSARNLIGCKNKKDRSNVIRLLARPHIMQNIDFLSDREYEALGCMACELVGATHVKLTPPGNEGGVDFFALINMPSPCHIFRGNCRPLRIVGQSKMYNSRVKVEKVKELSETLNQVRNLNPAITKHIPPWFRAADGPIIGWLIAHSGLQSGGVSQARNNGIIISDSIDIAEIIALSRKVDVSLDPVRRAALIRNSIDSYLENSEYVLNN